MTGSNLSRSVHVVPQKKLRPAEVVAENMRIERTRRRWSQADLAQRMNWARSTPGHIETGRRDITFDEFFAVCHVLGVSADVLLQGLAPEDQQLLS